MLDVIILFAEYSRAPLQDTVLFAKNCLRVQWGSYDKYFSLLHCCASANYCVRLQNTVSEYSVINLHNTVFETV